MYKEPKPYLTQALNSNLNTGVSPALIPVVVGEGKSLLTKTVSITRASGDLDTLPFTTVNSITRVGNLTTSSDYAGITDYKLTGANQIDWSPAGKDPTLGTTYYVTVQYVPDASQYELQWMSSKDQVISFYGPDVDSVGAINPISLAAQLVLENSSLVGVLQVKPVGANVIASDYTLAYDNYLRFAEDAYRIIPVGLKADINLATISHVNVMSDVDEGQERTTIIGADHTSSTATEVITNVGGYATSIKNKRVLTFYPDKATRELSDGITYTLTAPFIAAYLAGLKSRLPVQTAYTKQQVLGFKSLVGIKMTRAQLNLLASKGVTVLTQKASGYPIEIRHGLTTDMTSVQTREASVTDITDYVSKYLRQGLASYIGKHNIDNELIVKINGAIKSMFSILGKERAINDGAIRSLYQDAAAPDSLVAAVAIQVPYPCNYIEITLYLD